jgi:hypothetical protein
MAFWEDWFKSQQPNQQAGVPSLPYGPQAAPNVPLWSNTGGFGNEVPVEALEPMARGITGAGSAIKHDIDRFGQHIIDYSNQQFPLQSGLPQQTQSTDYNPGADAARSAYELALGLVGPGMARADAHPVGGGDIGIFGGAASAGGDYAKLAQAKVMENASTPREQILRDTGWFKGVDGQWKYEINDRNAGFRLDNPAKGQPDLPFDPKLSPLPTVPFNTKVPGEYRAADIVSHPGAFDAYPQLGENTIKFEDLGNPKGSRGYSETELDWVRFVPLEAGKA